MIAGIKTAAELKADADAYTAIFAAPNSIGTKIKGELEQLVLWAERNLTAYEKVFSLESDVRIPTAAIAQIQATWGYVLTVTNGVSKPKGYTGPIANWSRINKISWNI